ncbi:MAG: hypothetical protein NTY53_15540 [Kiritimatiellaeota bacterium]|nr:hypothetical protein [Kiritimatiellota bacterium]
MRLAWLFGTYFGLCCVTGLAQKDDAVPLAEAEKLGAKCVTQMAGLKQAAAPDEATHKQRYLQALGKLEAQLKAKGDISKVVTNSNTRSAVPTRSRPRLRYPKRNRCNKNC